MPITNPNPVSPGACLDFWVSDLTITPGMLLAILRPYDGTYVIGNRTKKRRVFVTNLIGDALVVVNAITAEVKRLAGKDVAVDCLNVTDADPAEPIVVSARFVDGSYFHIDDLMAILTTDQAVAGSYAALMAFLGSVASN